MKRWYLFYTTKATPQILQQAVEELQWSFQGIETPMGVATYNNIRIKDALPTQEQLQERMRLLQKELQEIKRLIKKEGKRQ